MWFTRFLVLYILACAGCFVRGENDYYSVTEKREGSKFCGKGLVNALSLVCGGYYNTLFNKKSDPDMESNWLREIEMMDSNYENEYNLFRPKFHVKALMPYGRYRRSPHGVYDECCRKACSVTEMMGYCAPRP